MTTSVQNTPYAFKNWHNTTTPCTTSSQGETQKWHASSYRASSARHGASWSQARDNWRSTATPASLTPPASTSSPWWWSPTTTTAATSSPPTLAPEPTPPSSTPSPFGTTILVTPSSQAASDTSARSDPGTVGANATTSPATAPSDTGASLPSTAATSGTPLPAAGAADFRNADLSDGQIAGITVGSVVAAALAGLSCWALVFFRRPRRSLEGDT